MSDPENQPALEADPAEGVQEDAQRTLKRDTLRGAIVSGSGIGLGLVSQVVLAKVLSLEGYGLYTYVITILGVVMLATRHGWDILMIRNVAAFREKQEWALLRGILRRGFQLSLGATAAAAAVQALIGLGLQSPFGWALVIGAPVLVVWTALSVAGGLLNGLGRVVLGHGLQTLLAPGAFLAAVLGAAYLKDAPLEGSEALVLYGGAFFLALLIAIVASRRRLGELGVKAQAPRYETRAWLKVALPLAVAVAADLLLRRTDVLCVGGLLGTTQAGIYRVAVLGSVVAITVVVAAEVALSPLCSRSYTSGQVDSLRRLVRLTSLLSFVTTALGGVGLWLVGEPLLRWLRPEFVAAFPPLLILLWGAALGQLFGPTRSLAMMASEQRAAAWSAGIGVAINVALNLALIPRYDLLGAAYATAITLFLTRGGLWLYLRRKIGVDTSVFSVILPTPPRPEWAQAEPSAS
jgi:O-antigen/teichoic acid export membrane protein